MADHFEEIVNLRLRDLDARIDDEANAVQEHFEEFKKFLTHSLNKQSIQLRAEFRAELRELRGEVGKLRADVGRLEQRLESYQEANKREFKRLEDKMDARFDAMHLILREILSRLPRRRHRA